MAKTLLEVIPKGFCKEVDILSDILETTYLIRLRLEFTMCGISKNVYCNKKPIMIRKKKFEKIIFGENVKLIEGEPWDIGGSNKWPEPRFKGGYCVLEWINKGFPVFDEFFFTTFNVEFLKFEKVDIKQPTFEG